LDAAIPFKEEIYYGSTTQIIGQHMNSNRMLGIYKLTQQAKSSSRSLSSGLQDSPCRSMMQAGLSISE